MVASGSIASFTPALGHHVLTPLYDPAVALLTREKAWRERLVSLIAARAGERILDVGCGTGTLVLKLKLAVPGIDAIGVDPDPKILALAVAKAKRKGLSIDYRPGFLTAEVVRDIGPVSVVTSSLVLHQTPLVEKARILDQAHAALVGGGRIVIADYGLQRTSLMRALFRLTVQQADGVPDTQPNMDGVIPMLMQRAGFTDAREVSVVPTPTGSVSLYFGTKS